MILNPKEAGIFWSFRSFVESEQHIRSKLRLIFADKSEINCTYFTSCESDNCLDLEDPNYEEYWIIVFRNTATNELFEVNYHNMPVEVWCDGIKVDLEAQNDKSMHE